MEKEELYQIAKDAVNEAELKSDEIPSIDLYVDQIINLVAEKLKQSSERFHERQLTKTMINNYSKDGLITPVKGKKYTKEQVIQMLTVYTLKSSLSIGEIKRLLNGAYSAENFSGEDLTRLYDRHLDIKQENRAYAEEILFSLIEGHGLDLSDMDDYITAVGAVISLSAHLKNIAQAMIDAQFPEPEEPEEDEKSEKSGQKKPVKKKKAGKRRKNTRARQKTVNRKSRKSPSMWRPRNKLGEERRGELFWRKVPPGPLSKDLKQGIGHNADR